MRTQAADIPRLITAYYSGTPTSGVSFGTSGHRGTSFSGTFNEAHVAAICQAVSELRPATGPLYLGKDTHALSEPACATALEVFAGNGIPVILGSGYTPTPVLSRAVLVHNQVHSKDLADAVVLTPSHNPPSDGGFKYNPPSGGPAPAELTVAIQDRACELMDNDLRGVKRVSVNEARLAGTTSVEDLMTPYVTDLAQVIDMEAIAAANLKIGVDPMGGAAVRYWEAVAERYALDLHVVNMEVDPAFGFMPLDHDGCVRMDCSSKHAMANLLALRDKYDIAFGNDPDVDRHGIVTRSVGLMNPNHFLAVASNYLFEHRSAWSLDTMLAKTFVSSQILNRVAGHLGRTVLEVPVGFKWFVDGLHSGSIGFAGEESAGASFLRRDGTVWTTDKDGLIMGLLAAEILATTGLDPGEHYLMLTKQFGSSVYRRIDAPATPAQKAALASMTSEAVQADALAGEAILQKLTHAPGNNAPIGGLKVVTENGWFAARPSGTEDIYKIYAESLAGQDHLETLLQEAQAIVNEAIGAR